jgi:hypothetical protein
MGTYLTKGETFATGNTVTAAKLNNLVDNATVTAGSIGSTELATNAVTADKISTASPQPVTTGTIRAGAVSNAKLAAMGSQTVKVRATNSTGDASDLAMIGGGTNGSSKTAGRHKRQHQRCRSQPVQAGQQQQRRRTEQHSGKAEAAHYSSIRLGHCSSSH